MNAEQLSQSKKQQLYRFKLMQGNQSSEGNFEKTKTVGMAYMTEGTKTYSLKLWTFLNDRFYLVPRKHDQSLFLVLTKEPNRNPAARNRSFSNIVGNAKVDPALGVIKIEFDLLDKPIYMSIYPETQTQSSRIQEPEALDAVA